MTTIIRSVKKSYAPGTVTEMGITVDVCPKKEHILKIEKIPMNSKNGFGLELTQYLFRSSHQGLFVKMVYNYFSCLNRLNYPSHTKVIHTVHQRKIKK